MFPYLQVSLGCKLVARCFDLYVTWRQHRRYAPHVKPSPSVAAIIPNTKFVEAQKYCLSKSGFQIFMGVVEGIMETLFLLTFLAPRIWYFAGRYTAGSELKQTLLFSALYGFIGMVLELPGSLYSTFVLEAKFGFNRTTARTFVLDMLKEIVLSVVLGVPLLSLLYYVLDYFSGFSPVTVAAGLWGLLSTLLIAMMIIYPSIIAPLFNKFDPLPEGELKQKLVAMAKKLGFPLDKLYVIDGSQRSSHSNAYIFGLFRKYICIYDTLLEQNKGKNDQVAFIKCLLYGLTAGNEALFRSFGYHEGMPLVIGLLLLNEMLAPIDELLTPLLNSLSRRMEYQADAFAKKQGMSADLGRALIGMSITNLSNMSPDPLYSTWNYSHPTLLERLSALDTPPDSKKED